MKCLHLSDLHLGRRLREADLEEDQNYLLNEIFNIAVEKRVDAVLIAGDVYDRSVPTVGAVRMFDEFLTRLSQASIPCTSSAETTTAQSVWALRTGFWTKRRASCLRVRRPIGALSVPGRFWTRDHLGHAFLKPRVRAAFYPEESIESYTDAVAVV